jgi:Flp pilus assembly protein TadB
MNGGYAEFFVKQSISDTKRSFRIVSRGKQKTYRRKPLPRIRRCLKVRVADSEPTHDAVGPIIIVMLAVPLLSFLSWLHGGLPVAVILAGAVAFFILRWRNRKASLKRREV